MSEYTARSLKELVALIAKHGKARTIKVQRAAQRAASRGRRLVKENVPVAHGELRESVHTEGMTIVVDAPHAAAVNLGSRPHWMPIGPLIEWVKLRGTQGLLSERQMGRLPGTTSASAAQGVAAMLRNHEVEGPGGYSPTDAVERVARAIQRAIAKRGTKAHHFIEKSLPGIRAILGEEILRALGEDPGGGGDDPLDGTGPGGARQYFQGSRGGVYYRPRTGGKVYVSKEQKAALQARGEKFGREK